LALLQNEFVAIKYFVEELNKIRKQLLNHYQHEDQFYYKNLMVPQLEKKKILFEIWMKKSNTLGTTNVG
jgi:hypothetical protein